MKDHKIGGSTLRDHMIDFMFIILGSFLMGIAYSAFIAPHNIVPGGVYGISIIINHLTKGLFSWAPNGFPIGTVALFFNIPLFLLAVRGLGRFSGVKTVLTFFLIAFFTDLIGSYLDGKALVEGDTILSSFYGGAILGLSVWMIFRAQSTAAGTDTLARVIAKRYNVKLSNLIMLIDSVIVMLGLIAFGDWRVPLYSWITIFIYSKVIDLLQPQNTHKAVFIISDKPKEIRDALIQTMGVRGTFLHGQGMYQGIEREVIFIIIQRKNTMALKKITLSIDPKAFISTSDASNDTTPQLI